MADNERRRAIRAAVEDVCEARRRLQALTDVCPCESEASYRRLDALLSRARPSSDDPAPRTA